MKRVFLFSFLFLAGLAGAESESPEGAEPGQHMESPAHERPGAPKAKNSKRPPERKKKKKFIPERGMSEMGAPNPDDPRPPGPPKSMGDIEENAEAPEPDPQYEN